MTLSEYGNPTDLLPFPLPLGKSCTLTGNCSIWLKQLFILCTRAKYAPFSVGSNRVRGSIPGPFQPKRRDNLINGHNKCIIPTVTGFRKNKAVLTFRASPDSRRKRGETSSAANHDWASPCLCWKSGRVRVASRARCAGSQTTTRPIPRQYWRFPPGTPFHHPPLKPGPHRIRSVSRFVKFSDHIKSVDMYLQAELLSGCAKSLEYIQCRVTAIHIFRVEIAFNKLTGLFFDPGLYFVSAERWQKNQKIFITAILGEIKMENCFI